MLLGELSYLMVQMNPHLGNLRANTDYIKGIIAEHQNDSDIIIFPELSICGYPPEDLVFRNDFLREIEQMLSEIIAEAQHCTAIVGYPKKGMDGKVYNSAAVIQQGRLIASYDKQKLPNYKVFDEKRYFTEGTDSCVVSIKNRLVGVLICEDTWFKEPAKACADAGAELIISINASPYSVDSHQRRMDEVQQRVEETGLPIIYVNQVGGQDELVFDGASIIINGDGSVVQQAPAFIEGCYRFEPTNITEYPELLPAVYQALVIGLRDYVNKNGFKSVLLGLSGGIDSSLTVAIAVDALGAKNVTAVMLPYRYTSDLSKTQAAVQAQRLGVNYFSLGIEPIVDSALSVLEDSFKGTELDVTEQNIQSRSRGLILMALSNKKGSLLLTTGNKSEVAVGYATLYGDMAGGYNVLKDVLKMQVYQLSVYRNSLESIQEPVIPVEVIERPPSAELAPDQKDEDNLPPYEVLDGIIEAYVEQDYSLAQMIDMGYDETVIKRIVRLIQLNEHKRSQAAIGTRITNRGFGRDRRYPITSGWRL